MALVKVAADKRHLTNPQGNPFFLVGINYAGYFDRAWKMWEPDLFDPALIERDFRKAQESGFNAVRLFVHPALARQVQQNDFSRLDHVLALAQDHDLLALLTFNDAHDLTLSRVAEIDAKIADRYKDVSTVFAYDLENEPVFYNLVAANYPDGYPAPVQTSQLVDHYGERVSRAEAADLQARRRIPGHLDPDRAYYYINALRVFLEFDAVVNNFIRQGKGTLLDFLVSGEAEPWMPLMTIFDGTVQAWLRAQIDPIRATGCHQLLTVGWNWLHFAGLPANRLLDFQSYHNYAPLSRQGFNLNLAHLESLAAAFPNHPIVFGEFGWSNQTSTNPANSRQVDPHLTALYEAATYAYLRANDYAGGFKWMLNDVQISHNPYEASFGVFRVGDQPKPVRDLIRRFRDDLPPIDAVADFTPRPDFSGHFAYRFNSPDRITIGGVHYQDDAVSWRGEGVSHCYLRLDGNQIWIDAQTAGRLVIDPAALLPRWDSAREAHLYRVFDEQRRTRQAVFGPGLTVEFDLLPGALYLLAMGEEQPVYPPPDGAPQVQPQPGEHVLLLADSDQYLQAALGYIRRFAPDFTFAVDKVAGRWAYVTVVAPPDVVPDTVLDHIRGAGARLVERVVGPTVEETKTRLNEMARRGQRFLTAIAPPPQEEPPAASPDDQTAPPPSGLPQTYTVQPGDTLSKIAKELYGDFRLWTLIYEANRDQISDPSLIRVGMALKIPEQG